MPDGRSHFSRTAVTDVNLFPLDDDRHPVRALGIFEHLRKFVFVFHYVHVDGLITVSRPGPAGERSPAFTVDYYLSRH